MDQVQKQVTKLSNDIKQLHDHSTKYPTAPFPMVRPESNLPPNPYHVQFSHPPPPPPPPFLAPPPPGAPNYYGYPFYDNTLQAHTVVPTYRRNSVGESHAWEDPHNGHGGTSLPSLSTVLNGSSTSPVHTSPVHHGHADKSRSPYQPTTSTGKRARIVSDEAHDEDSPEEVMEPEDDPNDQDFTLRRKSPTKGRGKRGRGYRT